MKIVCDKCSTKYSIADEKVRGKVFKIRCKKCSHIIVVKGNEGAAAADGGGAHDGAVDGGDEGATMVASSGADQAAVATDKVWYLVVGGEQIGPLTPAEVRAKFAAGEVDGETYGWREGFSDWLRLAAIDEFRDLGAKAAAATTRSEASAAPGGETKRTDLNDVFASHQGGHEDEAGGADLFGGAHGGARSEPAPAAGLFAGASGGGSAGDDLFGGAGASGSAGVFGEASDHAKPRGGAGGGGLGVAASGEAKLTGQRNENSVLFSLNNLQALATGGGGGGPPKPSASTPAPESRPGYASTKTEGSGLIDIRAMAAATLSAVPGPSGGEGGSDAPGFGAAPVFSPVVSAPILMPAPSAGMPKWVWGVIGGAVLFVVTVVILLVVVLTREPKQTVVVSPTPTSPSQMGTQATPTPPAAKPETTLAAAEKTGAAPAAVHEEEKTAKGGRHETKAGHRADAKHEAAPAPAAKSSAAAPPPEPAPAPPPSKKAKPKDDLDSLLDNATGGSSAPRAHQAAAAPAADDPSLPEQLARGDIQAGMSAVKGRVQGCFDQYKVPGTAVVAITIDKTGKVKSASVGGALSGTPTGDCVARAAKTATFKRFRGAPMSISYPFILR
jgi:predicted Zn finger-like uncharacterized protein